MSDSKRPRLGAGWVRRPDLIVAGCRSEIWERRDLRVLSSFGGMEAPDSSGDVLLTWLVSVSRRGASQPSTKDMARVRRDFDMKDAEEDNHESGIARKLFLVVDPARRVGCECKTTERVIERPDGYRFSVPKDRTP